MYVLIDFDKITIIRDFVKFLSVNFMKIDHDFTTLIGNTYMH